MSAGAGFSILEQVFKYSSMRAVVGALERAELVRSKAGARHVLAVPAVRALSESPALLEIARRYLGLGAFPFRATLFDKSAASNWLVTWHQDTSLPIQRERDAPGWGPWSMKGGLLHANAPAKVLEQVIALRVHLDDSTIENGPLRVLPGTHTLGVLPHEEIERLTKSVAAVDCLVSAGGVVAMCPLVVHASSKARSDRPRRVLHIEYAAAAELDDGIELSIG